MKKHREDRGWSQEELAFECGLHRTYISGVERGVRNPTVVVLQKIAKALKVPAAVLLEEGGRR
jgi:transcriptional regulator with XRE-family HTH domain